MGIAKNCSLGQTSYGESYACPENKGEELALLDFRRKLVSFVLNKSSLEKNIVSHWLQMVVRALLLAQGGADLKRRDYWIFLQKTRIYLRSARIVITGVQPREGKGMLL